MWVHLLFPETCVGCGLWRRGSADPIPLCRRCALEHTPLPPGEVLVGGIHARDAYGGPLARAVARLKLEGALALAGPLGRHLATAPIWADGWDAVVPVPLHWRRSLVRGFDQTTLLVQHARRGIAAPPPLRRGWLRRVRATAPQRTLPASRRGANVRDAFACPCPGDVRGARVLVVDDVVTTGSTLHAAMAPLRAAGAARVAGLALLRALA